VTNKVSASDGILQDTPTWGAGGDLAESDDAGDWLSRHQKTERELCRLLPPLLP
jgi:hypothetical protein